MKIYLDANIAPQLASGLNNLTKPLDKNIEVLSIPTEFGDKVADEDWIPILGKEEAIVITHDYRIQRTRNQRDLYHDHGLGIFFFKISKGGITYWDTVRQLVNRWEKIIKYCKKKKRPFAYKFTQRGEIEEID